MKVANQEDSLTYVTAELQYMLGNYKEAAAGLATYMSRFCSGGRYCTTAAWYAADSHYRLGNYDEAVTLYRSLLDIQGNPYMEETCTRLAELLYEKKDYAAARDCFYRMRTLATQRQNRIAADLGVLRCSFFLEDDTATVSVATRLIEDSETTDNVRDEALYNRGKAYYRAGQYGQAAVDFSPLSKNVRVVTGAEAAYLLADCYFRLGALDSSESEIMRFAGQKTQHQYWLAKSLILLSDINVSRGELFQAKQYLLSLQTNYKADDDIMTTISGKLEDIARLENPETEEQPEQEEEEEL
jgi:tetratricopeptide (TPR) repeat protein